MPDELPMIRVKQSPECKACAECGHDTHRILTAGEISVPMCRSCIYDMRVALTQTMAAADHDENNARTFSTGTD